MSEFWILILLGVLGVFVHQAKKVWDKNGKNTKLKDILHFMKDNWFNVALSVITVIVIVVSREDMVEIMPVSRLSAFVIGWWGDSLLMSIVNSRKPEEGKE